MRLTATGNRPVGGRMRLTMQQRQAVVAKMASCYQRSRKKREEYDLERVGGADGIQSCLCQESAAATWPTNQVGKTSVSSGCASALTTTAGAIL